MADDYDHIPRTVIEDGEETKQLNTPAPRMEDPTADSWGLPSGYKIDEDGGDLVARDTNGNVVLRYNDDGGQWETNSISTECAQYSQF